MGLEISQPYFVMIAFLVNFLAEYEIDAIVTFSYVFSYVISTPSIVKKPFWISHCHEDN